MSNNDAKDRIENDPLLMDAMAEILRIQPRFSPDPVFSKTGVGVLKGEGVEELKKMKDLEKKSKPQSSSE
jgi:hypothetical protein